MSEAQDYTIDELMAAVLAREIRDGDIGMPTAMCPLGDAAICLAKHTHAKGLIWYGHNGWDPDIAYTLDTMHDTEAMTRNSLYIPDWGDILSQMLRGMVGFQIVAPAQIDQHGNMNNNVIGEHEAPKVRLPGSVGMPEIGCLHQRVLVYEPRHNTRVFVEKVDFIAGLGQLPGGAKARRERGIIGGGPQIVVTNLCVMDFEEESGHMRLRSIHAGVSAEEIAENTGFELLAPEHVPTTELPTAEQVRLLRERIDPRGLRRHRM